MLKTDSIFQIEMSACETMVDAPLMLNVLIHKEVSHVSVMKVLLVMASDAQVSGSVISIYEEE